MLVEPIQGEAGVIVPPVGYLAAVRAICDEAGALFVADEVQSGLGRTGHLLATRAAGVDADVYLLGKALGGGIMPLSAVVADADVLGVLRPGQHGSTFGGNPLACAIGRAVLELLADDRSGRHARPGSTVGRAAARPSGRDDRARSGRGCAASGCGPGSTSSRARGTGREISEAMARRGVLVKDTHGSTIRLSPPLVISDERAGPGGERARRGLDRIVMRPLPRHDRTVRRLRRGPRRLPG